MNFSLLKRRKVSLLFLLGVGVPSLALSLLAFRGLQNELAFLEQRRLDEHRALAELIGDTLAAHIDATEKAFSHIASERVDPLSSAPVKELDSLKTRDPLIEAVFFLDESGSLQLFMADLLFRADGTVKAPEPSAWIGPASEYMRVAQQQEFQQNRYDAALTSYLRAFDAVSDSVLKGEALLAITRVQRKAGRLDEALGTWERLLLDFDRVRTAEGMHLGPIAFLEQGAMLRAMGDSLAALRSGVDLYRRLVDGQWELERAQYDFLAGQAASSVRELSDALSGAIVDSLEQVFAASTSEESVQREWAERILLLQESAGQDLLARMGRDGDRVGSYPFRYSLDSGGEPFLVSLLGRPGSGEGYWGLLLDAEYLGGSVLGGLLKTHVDSMTTEWVIRGRDGSTVLAQSNSPQGSPTVNATFTGNFPPWLMEFYQLSENPYRRLLASGESIYLYMFLAIATILGVGLILTIRAITQELEVARLKSDFVSTVSHEFKSPLTSIRHLAEMLQTGRVPSEERRQHYYDILVEQSSRLSSLLTNVLDLARIEQGRKGFRLEPVDLGALVRDLVEDIQHRVGHEGLEVSVQVREPLPTVRGDLEALRQAISNLLNNAIQYSGDAKRIRLRVSAEDGVVSIAVEDSGVGIPEDEIGKVFDRFYRGGDEVTRSVPGSGLGLTLVKETADAHGGTVSVKSQVGKGSTFCIQLPAMTEPNDG